MYCSVVLRWSLHEVRMRIPVARLQFFVDELGGSFSLVNLWGEKAGDTLHF